MLLLLFLREAPMLLVVLMSMVLLLMCLLLICLVSAARTPT